ncbi:MAG: aminotransferase class I/II-fold pyridoxal phosphate-dependent enzyme [Phycisphaerales bacterium]|nr:aminotransferase class I/II-fold pyridoxal phosphate-dependent enzyme [Phycisphaerales bacterium]
MSTQTFNPEHLISDRAKHIEASGIRAIWALAQKCTDPIDLSIGQPDFNVPDLIKRAAIEAIQSDQNGYSKTVGIEALIERITTYCTESFGWDCSDEGSEGVMVTTGTAGALTLACLALLNPGDELIIPDPYFLIYPTLATIAGARPVSCLTYPTFKMTAQSIEACITSKTKAVILNSPSNPTGVVYTNEEVKVIVECCESHGILLITDEIYDEFVFSPATFATPATHSSNVLLIRGFGKTYGCTGWRLGYAAGPKAIISEMMKLQQQTFVCAPTPLQHAVVQSFDTDLSTLVEQFANRRDMVVDHLSPVTEMATPEGAFYAFPKVPEHLGMNATEFVHRCIEENLLLIQGSIFSSKDTHVRLSFATPEDKLERGLQKLASLMK